MKHWSGLVVSINIESLELHIDSGVLMMNRRNRRFGWILVSLLLAVSTTLRAQAPAAQPARENSGIPEDAQYACPMETHPDQENPDERGTYFAAAPGQCPRCGMKLKPLDELEWVEARKAAGGAEVAYTCPDHQHVFSTTKGQCPKCDKDLKPFKVMYTCPNPSHAHMVATSKGRCQVCGRRLAPFRGIWLDEDMASANVPPTTQPAADAPYRCPLHPLVHSQQAGRCTICAMELTPGGKAPGKDHTAHPQALRIPEGAKYVCPMKECETFSKSEGECPVCGMDLKPIDEVNWARELSQATQPAADEGEEGATLRIPPGSKYVCPMQECETFSPEAGKCPVCGMNLKPIESVEWAHALAAQTTRPAGETAAYVCPMHPQVKADSPGTCSICAMQLVRADQHAEPREAPEQIQQQINHITEHYLALQRLLASDNTSEIPKHALGVASAGEELLKSLNKTEMRYKDEARRSIEELRSAALKMDGDEITADRVHFVDLSSALVSLLEHLRPDRDRWPDLYVFHCPMSKGDWIQTSKETRNPYYGFQMLNCGELKAAK